MTPFERAWRYAEWYDKRKLNTLTRKQCMAIGYEAGLKSRAGMSRHVTKTERQKKVFVKPKNP